MRFLDYLFHLDQYLTAIIDSFGPWTYVILFLIIFAETGFVITPFLPGDSLLFTIGTLCGLGLLNVWIIYFLLLAAAIIGDSVNYWIGQKIGPKVFANKKSNIFKPKYLQKTQEFYRKYGAKTIIIARFVPIVRTFAPFVAGVGTMCYRTFITYNIVGAFLWVTLFVWTGYFLGGLPIVKNNIEYVIIGIIIISIIPMVIEYIKEKQKK